MIIKDVRKSLNYSFKKNINQIALIFNGKKLTYKEISERSSNLMNAVGNLKTDTLSIGILSDRDESAYVSVAGSIIHGYTFVPLNPKFPDFRLRQIIETSMSKIIITNKDNYTRAQKLVKSCLKKVKIIIYEDHISVSKKPNKNLDYLLSNSNQNIYTLFTSGTTGTPKGVTISNSNLCSFINNLFQNFNFYKNDILSQTFDLSFDLSIFGILGSWLMGAKLCLMSKFDSLNPVNYMNKNQITVWFSVPSIIRYIQTLGKTSQVKSLRVSYFCGDSLFYKDVDYWKKLISNTDIYNLYGPTEGTIACSYFKIQTSTNRDSDHDSIVPIGKLFDNIKYILLNDDEININLGAQKGELCISGKQVFDGYIKDSKDSFIIHKNDSYYKTGDVVELLDTNNFIFLGRTDAQIKFNGFRIELQEIEVCIRNIVGVEQVFVKVIKENSKIVSLLAIVQSQSLTADKVEKYLAKVLPYYMIPKKIEIVKEIPLNVNGKLDRNFYHSNP